MAEGTNLLPWDFRNVYFNNPAMNDARTHRKETPDKLVERVERLAESLRACPDVRPNLSNDFLLRFLRGSSFVTTRALRRIRNYYACQKNHPEIFGSFLPSCTMKAQSLNHIYALPFRAKDNSIIVVHKLGVFDSRVCCFEELVRLDFLILESLLTNPVTQLCGITVIADLKGFSAEKFQQFSPARIQSIFELYDRDLTMRIVAGHIINAPAIIRSLYNLLSASINEGLRASLVLHPVDEWGELHSQIPKEILPIEYFGRLPPNEVVNLYNLINYNEDFFKEFMKYGESDRFQSP